MLNYLSRRGRLLVIISLLTTFAESMLVPMYAAFTEKVGGSILDAAIAYGVFAIATGLAIGLVGTRQVFERHTWRFLMAGFVASVLCDLSYILVQNKWQLFGVQIVAGLASGLIEPAWDSLFTDGIQDSAAKHWSVWAGGTHFLSGVAAFAGGLIAAWSSFTVLFISMASIDTVAVVLCLRGRQRETSVDTTPKQKVSVAA
jgi:MFS family permease